MSSISPICCNGWNDEYNTHEWRQPLTTLSLIAKIKIYLFNQLKQVRFWKIKSQYEKSIKLIQYMSKTINNFQNFFQAML